MVDQRFIDFLSDSDLSLSDLETHNTHTYRYRDQLISLDYDNWIVSRKDNIDGIGFWHNVYGPAYYSSSDDEVGFMIHGHRYVLSDFLNHPDCRCSDELKMRLLLKYG